MRKLYALALLLCCYFSGYAAPGDTTWVQAQNNAQLTNYGAFDIPVVFPTGSVTYRKVYMVFTLGTYSCPAGSQYCHQWDYDVHNIIMTPGGDTIELSRFITPYANTGVPRFPSNWKHRYIFDVSDYYPLLKGSNTFRIFYSGYSYGFTANVRFAFVEGTPERNVQAISKLWGGSYTYGNSADPIDNRVTAVSRTAPAGTQSAEMKVLITGHGSDANGCCEFASHDYELKVNGGSLGKTSVWRADCGYNDVYPQGGTWIYDRANWCPGATVAPFSHKLPGISSGSTFSTDLDFDPYTISSNFGSYNLQANLIYYSGFNKTSDASLEDIMAPTDYEGYFRSNPSDGKPIVKIRNSGSSTITSMQIVYGVKDSAMSTYNWTGSLAPLAETWITLPELLTLRTLSLNGASGAYTFVARVGSVNGSADNDIKNDTLRSSFTVAPTWPKTFVVNMKTNSVGTGGVGQGPSESSWKITDAAGNTVASRIGATISTTYNDTVSLQNGGMYKLTVSDGSCDGLNWWVWNNNPQYNITSGNLIVRQATTGVPISMKGTSYSGTYLADFGCGFTQAFSIAGSPAGISGLAKADVSLVVYPNPAQDKLTIDVYGSNAISGTISLVDAVGRKVLAQKVNTSSIQLSLTTIAPGIYQVEYEGQNGRKTVERVSIIR